MTEFVVFVLVLIVVLRYVITKLASQDSIKRLIQREAVAEQFRRAAAEQAERAAKPPSQVFPVPPPPRSSPPPSIGMQPALPTAPATPDAPPPPTSVAPPPEPDTSLSTSLDSSLSTTLGSPMAESSHAAVSGPQVVQLSPELERRAIELMEQNYEVMAVRLLCDQLDIGILDAQKTVRTLVGLPTTY